MASQVLDASDSCRLCRAPWSSMTVVLGNFVFPRRSSTEGAQSSDPRTTTVGVLERSTASTVSRLSSRDAPLAPTVLDDDTQGEIGVMSVSETRSRTRAELSIPRSVRATTSPQGRPAEQLEGGRKGRGSRHYSYDPPMQ